MSNVGRRTFLALLGAPAAAGALPQTLGKALVEPNITPWRRAVAGDLTSAFDFRKPNTSWRVRLPDTSDLEPVNLVRHADQVPIPPSNPSLPGQEQGVRPARAIPYTLHADGLAGATSFGIHFQNSGAAAGVFHV